MAHCIYLMSVGDGWVGCMCKCMNPQHCFLRLFCSEQGDVLYDRFFFLAGWRGIAIKYIIDFLKWFFSVDDFFFQFYLFIFDCAKCCCVGSSVVVESRGYTLVAVRMACGIFPDQGSNPCLLHWQAESLSLSHQGSPVIDFWSELDVH